MKRTQDKRRTQVSGVAGIPDDACDVSDDLFTGYGVDQVEEQRHDAVVHNLAQAAILDEVRENVTGDAAGDRVSETLAESNKAAGCDDVVCVDGADRRQREEGMQGTCSLSDGPIE